MKIYLIIMALSLFITAKSGYDLKNGEAIRFGVIAGITYTAYINAKKGQTAKILFSMDYPSNSSIPFKSVYINEFSKYNDLIDSKSIYSNLVKKGKNDRMAITANYDIRNYNCTYISFEFTSEYNFNDFYLKITVKKPLTASFVILVILISLLCCIFCVIGIICVIRRIRQPKTGPSIQTYIPIQPIEPPHY